MGRRNKKLAKIQQAQQAREFLKHREKFVSLKSLPPDQKRIEIAYFCTIILSNPELQYSKIESIFELCEDPDPSIQALAISSLASTFIDILPGYRIQSHEEEKVTLSKEVKALRIYESDLLKHYERFIQGLESHRSQGSIITMCRLLSGLTHFNYRERLLNTIFKYVNEITEVLEVIEKILKGNDLEFKFFTVKCIEKFVKSSSFKIIPEKIIELLSAVKFSRLLHDEIPKKRNRDSDENENNQEVTHNQKILREILSIYFLVVKKYFNTKLFIPTMKGLCKYADFLNVEIVLDLVKNLISLLKEDKVKAANRFHCVFACIRIISATQHALRFEDKDLTKVLYNALLFPPPDKTSQRIMIQGLSWLLIDQKQFSFDLVASFIKRIMQVSFHCDIDLMRSFICLVKQIMAKFPKSFSLLEDDEAINHYNPSMADPYLTEASSSSIVSELELLKTFKDPQIDSLIKALHLKVPYSKKALDYLI